MATDEATQAPTVGQVVGANIRRLREARRLTQHEAARLLQAVGLNWSRSRVAAAEVGDRADLEVSTLLLVARGFGVPVADLFAGTGDVRLSGHAVQNREGIRATLAGTSPRALDAGARVRLTGLEAGALFDLPDDGTVNVISVEADEALARKLDVPPLKVVNAAFQIWGRSLTEERDRRTGALGDMSVAERQGHRGRITRELAEEIENLLRGSGSENND